MQNRKSFFSAPGPAAAPRRPWPPHRQRGSQGRAGDGHLHRGPQQRQDLAEKAPVRREHLRRDVRQVVPAAPHQPQVAAGEPGRRQEEQEEARGQDRTGDAAPHTAASAPP